MSNSFFKILFFFFLARFGCNSISSVLRLRFAKTFGTVKATALCGSRPRNARDSIIIYAAELALRCLRDVIMLYTQTTERSNIFICVYFFFFL